MSKSLKEILANYDDEFEYAIHSLADIHDPERFERIHLTLLPYRVKQFESSGYKPWNLTSNKYFPKEPNNAVYTIKVVTGLPLDLKSIVQTIASQSRIHASKFFLEAIGDAPEETNLVNEPEEITDVQDLVGAKRIDAFMQELKKYRKEKEDAHTVTKEVYESFCVTHRTLEGTFGTPFLKGYYIGEAYQEAGEHFVDFQGPYKNKPDYNYLESIKGIATLVEQTDTGIKVKLEEEAEALHKFRLSILEEKTGRRFSTTVTAINENLAYEMALDDVAERYALSRKGLKIAD